MVTKSVRLPVPSLQRLLLLSLALSLVAAKTAHQKEEEEPRDAGSEEDADVDFPDDVGLELAPEHGPPQPVPRHSPVSVYVLRLLEILTGAETMGKHSRFAR